MPDDELAQLCDLAQKQIEEVVKIMLQVEKRVGIEHPEFGNLGRAIRKASDADLHFLLLAQRLSQEKDDA